MKGDPHITIINNRLSHNLTNTIQKVALPLNK